MSMYSYFMFMYLHRASWHSSATLIEVFPCFFLSCKANARVNPAKTGHGPHSSKLFVLFYVLFVLCRSVYCVCVNWDCTTAAGWLPNCSSQIYHVQYLNILDRLSMYYIASGIITPVGGRPVHRVRADCSPVHRTATYKCDDTRCCIIQFWPPDDEHIVLETCRGV